MKDNGKYLKGNGEEISKDEYAAAFRAAQSEEETNRKNGKLYQVDIPEQEEYLNLDKPMTNEFQSSSVLNAFNKAREQFPDKIRGGRGDSFYQSLANLLGSQKDASLWLKDHGVPGSCFKDQISRERGGSTYNYVIFDDSKINIKGIEESNGKNTLIDTNSLGKPIADSPEKLAAFWKWFNGSKIVDKQGRPIVVYHGTKTDFDNFDLNKIGLNGLALGPGFYFTDSESVAHGYGDVKSFYLKALNPTLSNEKKTITKSQVLKIIANLEKVDSDFLSNYGDINYDRRENIIRLAVDDIYNTSESDSDIIGSIINVGMIDRNRVMEIIKAITKKDAFIAKANLASHAAGESDKMYVVISPSQVKSINNKGTFSTGNSIIDEENKSNLIDTNSLGKPISSTPEGTKNFWKWFNGSKVVDSEGRPIVVYHGTRSNFNSIDLKKGAQGVFWVSSDKEKIERGESGAISSKVIMELYIKLKNPAHWDEYEKFGIGELIARGFDGVILNEDDGSFDAIIFHANQVKSVNNKGTFSNSSNLVKESNSSFKVPLDSLYSPKWKVEESYNEILKGELSRTDGPIKVSKIGRNKFFVIDGNHRTIEAILNSKSSIIATLDEFYPDLTKTGGAFNSELEKTVQVTSYLKSIF